MAQQAEAVFLQGSLLGHVTRMSLTASIGLMAVFLVDFADMIFISWLGKAELAAAVGYAGAILFFTTSFAIGMAIAAGALVARSLGAGNRERAREQAVSALGLGAVMSVALAIGVFLSLDALTAAVGASGHTRVLAVGYLSIIVPALPLLVFGIVGSAILRAYGDARRSMLASVSGGVVNAILDPILIFGLGLDLTGAALASVASRIVFAAAAMYPLIRHHDALAPFSVRYMRADTPEIARLAIPAVLTQLATPLGAAYVTRAMAQFGEAAVAGMAMAGRLTPVAFAAVFALSGAIGPIIGQNFGARRHDRVLAAFRDGMIFTAVYVIGAGAVLFAMRGLLADLFQADGVSRDIVFLFCGPLALAFFFNGAIFVSNAAFNNLGHPFFSTLVNWGRQTLGTVPFVALGAAWWGAEGVLIGQAAGGVVFGIAAVVLALRVMRKSASGEAGGERAGFTRRARQLQLFHLRR